MELRQLRAFVAVAEELHFRNAAERLGMAQAAVSSKIKDLECELGFELFFRTTRHVSLTQAGTVFLESVCDSLSILEDGVYKAGSAADNWLERLRVSGIDGALIWYLPPVLKAFNALHPTASLPMTEGSNSEDQINNLESHRVDIAFVRRPAARAGIKFELLLQERVYVALPREHKLANRKGSVSVRELADDPIISYPSNTQPYLNKAISNCFAKQGMQPTIATEVVNKFTAMQFASQGVGVAFLPEWVGALYSPKVPLKPIKDDECKLEFGVAWREKDRNQTLMEFLKPVRDHAAHAQRKLDDIWASRMAQEQWDSRLDVRSWV